VDFGLQLFLFIIYESLRPRIAVNDPGILILVLLTTSGNHNSNYFIHILKIVLETLINIFSAQVKL